MDAVPGFSQLKSLAQLISGRKEDAKETQRIFMVRCPVVSQGISLFKLFKGDKTGARETQNTFLKGVSSTVNSVPFVGHLKAFVHYKRGDREGAHNAVTAANRTLLVMAGGVFGFAVGGPAGAAVGGALGGSSSDVSISIQTDRPCGLIDSLRRIRDSPLDGGNYVDLLGGVFLDGMTGIAAGTLFEEQIKPRLSKRKLANADILDAAESMEEFCVNKKIKGNSTDVITEAKVQVPIPDGPTQLQMRDNDFKQVSTSTNPQSSSSGNPIIVITDHESQAIVNISQSENSSSMRTLVPLAIVTSSGAGWAIIFATEEPNECQISPMQV